MKVHRRGVLLILWLAAECGTARAEGLRHPFCGTYPGIGTAEIIASREARERRGVRSAASSAKSAAVSRNGDVALLVDQGDLVFPANPLDLQGKGLEFQPGYTVSRVDRPVGLNGTKITLGDDDTREVPLPFAFPFFGRAYDKAFINSDGNLTFGVGDNASSSRTLGRMVSGPPRVAPLLADLDPSSSGVVSTTSSASAFTVKWTDVPQFEVGDKNTFEVTLFSDGRISFAYDAALTPALEGGAVGISAGGGVEGLQTTDLSNPGVVSFSRSIGESFRSETDIDLTAVGRAFYSAFGDDYQQLVIYTNRSYIPRSQGAFAFQLDVRNTITGIGAPRVNSGADYGSAAALESVVLMDSITKYSTNSSDLILREESSMSVLAHEVGHRWLATARFLDGATASTELLGRQQAHWNFFMNSSGSHDEGNQIEDLGGGLFRTGAVSVRYGPLDQYLMGIRPEGEVPPFFVIRNPAAGGQSTESAPRSKVEIRGTRKDISIADIVAAMGPRSPAPAPGGAPWRMAFLYVTDGSAADASNLAAVDRLRAQFETFFAQSTEGRLTVETRLK